ncbi:MAG: PKD domain-containing protein, partial [Opitutaceae bacterium]
FTEWLTDWRRADLDGQAALAGPGVALARARRGELRDLIARDPAAALAAAIPAGLRGGLPPAVAAELEELLDARGDWEVTVSCPAPADGLQRTAILPGRRLVAHTHGRRLALATKFGLPLHGIAVDELAAFAPEPWRALDDDEKAARGLAADALAVSVGGEVEVFAAPAAFAARQEALLAAEAGEGPYLPGSVTPPAAANTPWILGPKRVLWVQVDFADDPGAVASAAEIEATNAQVAAFFAATSHGRTTFSFSILPGVLRMTRDKAFYNASATSSGQLQADAAVLAKAYDAANGGTGAFDPATYDRWIVLFKRMPAYSFGGQAQLTGPQVRMNGTISPGTTYHELGHTQGLRHAHTWIPAGPVATGPGTHLEYGDPFDAMGRSGSSPHNHFNVSQKDRLGYLPPEAIASVTTSGTYRLHRHDHADASGLRALRFSPAGLGYDLWVEHRRFAPTSFGPALADRVRQGLQFHWGPGRAPRFTSGSGSYLLDATPGSAGGADDAPLRLGETFVDPDAGITVRPLAVGGEAPAEYLDVQVAFGAFEGNAEPTLEVALPAGRLLARTNLTFRATASDPDRDPLYFRWDFGDGTLQPTLDSLTRRFLTGGVYTLRVSAHDGRGGVARRTFEVNVEDTLDTWTRRAEANPPTAAQLLYDVTHARGQFVAVGINQTVLTSPDGETWTRRTFPGGNSLTGVVHDGTRFVASGYRFNNATQKGLVGLSEDGVRWTTANVDAGTVQFWGIAHGAGRLVMVGDAGAIYTSTDGTNWAAAASGITNVLRSVAYADGLFVATGEGGRVLTSPDGLTWTNRSLPVTNSFTGVARHAGRWVVRSFNIVFASADGAAWTRVTAPSATNAATYRMLSVNGVLLAGLAGGRLQLAEDPAVWEGIVPESSTRSIRAFAAGGGRVVAVGSDGLLFSTGLPAAGEPALPVPTLRLEADALKVAVGKPNPLAAAGAGYARLELYANGVKVSEVIGPGGALSWTPAALGTYSLQVRGVDAAGAGAVSAAVPAIAGLTGWRWNGRSPTGADLNAATRIGDRWWIVGASGTVLTLDDQGEFTPVDFPTTQHLSGIAHANGRWVVTGPYVDAASREEIGSLWTSTDGYRWAVQFSGPLDNFSLNFAAHAAGTWLVGSSGGLLLTSADALNWTRRNSGVSVSLRAAARGADTWVVVGNNGRIVTSPDGATWTTRPSGVTGNLLGLAYAGDLFVAVGAGGVILTSPDGREWTRRTSGTTANLNGIARVLGAWVAAAETGGPLVSADGVNWDPASTGGLALNGLAVAAGGEGGLLLGRAGEAFAADASPAQWRRLGRGEAASLLGVLHAGGRFVAVGQGTDPVTRAPLVPIQFSTDGVSWTRAAPNAAFGNLNEVAFGQGQYVAVGDGGRILTSPDAAAWTARTSGATAPLLAIAAGPERFVAAGGGGTVLTSADGVAWAAGTSGVTTALNAAAFGAGRFVLVGAGGRILYSTDGAAWTAATSGVTGVLHQVGYFDGPGFLAVGDGGTMLASRDGVEWSPVETGVADAIYAVARTPLGYVASAGSNGALLVSPDATDWSVSALPVNRIIRGVAAGAGAIVAVGDQGVSLTYEARDSRPAPEIRTPPVAQAVVPGAPVRLTVAARHAEGAVYQWYREGVALAGANTPVLELAAFQAADAGSYVVAITSRSGTTGSTPAVLSVAAATDPGRLVNLSILTALAGADDAFTFGVVVGGGGTSGAKPLLLRAAGPSLIPLGLDPASILQDPRLELFTGQTAVGGNDNWGGGATLSAAFAQVGAFAYASPGSRDAALFLPALAPGAHSARIAGTGPGTVIAELYDATPNGQFSATTPRLVNVSVLKHLGPGLVAGFVVGGSAPRTVLVRAVGPTLGEAPFGVPGVVADPELRLFAGERRIEANDNWGGGAALAAAFARVGAFALPVGSRDAALLATLPPGAYTAQVSGVGGTTGVALVEVYEVP